MHLSFVLTLFILLILPNPLQAAAEGWLRLHGNGVTIVYDPSLPSQAELLLDFYPNIRNGIEQKIGWKLQAEPVIYLVADTKAFVKMGGSPIAAAIALAGKSRIVMNFGSTTPDFVLLSQTIRHEICHLILHHHIPRERMPRWLDEGLCEWASDSGHEDVSSRLEAIVTAYTLSQHGYSLSRLTKAFPSEGSSVALAYEASKSFMMYIDATYGRDGLLDVLSRLRSGSSLEDAFAGALSIPLPRLEEEWLQSLRHRARWLILAAGYVEEARARLAAYQHVLPAQIYRNGAVISAAAFLGLLVFTKLLLLLLLAKVTLRKRRCVRL